MISSPEEISAHIRKVLNIHGHGFHYAVVRRAQDLFYAEKSTWIFDAVEFPVVTQDHVTHIDFVLRSRTGRTVLVAECKRADPAKALWCFAQSPYTKRDPRPQEVIFDHLEFTDAHDTVHKPHVEYTERLSRHLGFELRTSDKGDGHSNRSSAIDQAITQVLRGTSGLIDHFDRIARESGYSFVSGKRAVRFIPAIFTTAQLWETDADISRADLKTGDLDKDVINAPQVDWIWFNYNRSPELKPEVKIESRGSVLGDLSIDLKQHFTRSVAVISTSGIDQFLCADLDEWLWI